MTTKINSSVVGYISAMTAGTISLSNDTSGTPNLGTLQFGNGTGIKITAGDGNAFTIAGGSVSVSDTTQMTSLTAASLVTGGGLAVGKKLWAAEDIISGNAAVDAGRTVKISNPGTSASAYAATWAYGDRTQIFMGAYSRSNPTSPDTGFIQSIAGDSTKGLYIAETAGTWIKLGIGDFVTPTVTINDNGTASSSVSTGALIVSGGAGFSGDIWVGGLMNGTATKAQYGDVAERYLADKDYEPGTVVVFGGEKEITESKIVGDRRVAGVISTNPAHLMNDALEGGLPVALTGRVPCKVVGYVRKGDLMVTSHIPGVARADNDAKVGTVIGKALEDYQNTEVGVIEVVVGRV